MQKTDEDSSVVRSNHRKMKASSTLSRKYTRRPKADAGVDVAIRRSPSIEHFRLQTAESNMNKIGQPATQSNPIARVVKADSRVNQVSSQGTRTNIERTTGETVSTVTARELKEQAIKKALVTASSESAVDASSKKTKSGGFGERMHFGLGRILIALGCAAAAAFAIVYFVNLNMPDISLKVAAMQTGIDASYPDYIPRNYDIISITSEDDKVTMVFREKAGEREYSLTEEKSSWDSNTLESNFVRKTYGEGYSVVREQGLTLFISGSNAAWVNGGKVFKIESITNTLTNKQIRAIATSL